MCNVSLLLSPFPVISGSQLVKADGCPPWVWIYRRFFSSVNHYFCCLMLAQGGELHRSKDWMQSVFSWIGITWNFTCRLNYRMNYNILDWIGILFWLYLTLNAFCVKCFMMTFVVIWCYTGKVNETRTSLQAVYMSHSYHPKPWPLDHWQKDLESDTMNKTKTKAYKNVSVVLVCDIIVKMLTRSKRTLKPKIPQNILGPVLQGFWSVLGVEHLQILPVQLDLWD